MRKKPTDEMQKRGILAASGLVAGDACMGVIIAILAILKVVPSSAEGILPDSVGIAIFILVGLLLRWVALKPSSFFMKNR
jgi:uncharacterized oligopeptide transporter (OPT) family protein